MTDWHLAQLTFGSDQARYHSHSYYDIPVIDRPGRRIAAYQVRFAERQPTADDPIEVGIVDTDQPGSWEPVGQSRAWSWQQGPLAQWIGGGPSVVWNDRDGDRFTAQVVNIDSGARETLPLPVYAVDAAGHFVLSVNMARLDVLRPGYGYPDGSGARLDEACPADDGVWRLDLAAGSGPRLVLPLARAVAFLREMFPWWHRLRHRASAYRYWFNHVKVAPDSRRFTVKLRWRRDGGSWSDRMGVSLTCGVDGDDLRLLADATSHVIWLNDSHAYFWRRGEVVLFEDRAPRGMRRHAIAADSIDDNVHIRHLPPGPTDAPSRFVFDTPYREAVDLCLYDVPTATPSRIARFRGHVPVRGPFRCDLHPCPSETGDRIVVTSLHDGGRQVYMLTRANGSG